MTESDLISIIIACVLTAAFIAQIVMASVSKYTDFDLLKEKDFEKLKKKHAQRLELKRYLNYSSFGVRRRNRTPVPLDAPEKPYMGLLTGSGDCLVVTAFSNNKSWLAAKCTFSEEKKIKMQEMVDRYNALVSAEK